MLKWGYAYCSERYGDNDGFNQNSCSITVEITWRILKWLIFGRTDRSTEKDNGCVFHCGYVREYAGS